VRLAIRQAMPTLLRYSEASELCWRARPGALLCPGIALADSPWQPAARAVILLGATQKLPRIRDAGAKWAAALLNCAVRAAGLPIYASAGGLLLLASSWWRQRRGRTPWRGCCVLARRGALAAGPMPGQPPGERPAGVAQGESLCGPRNSPLGAAASGPQAAWGGSQRSGSSKVGAGRKRPEGWSRPNLHAAGCTCTGAALRPDCQSPGGRRPPPPSGAAAHAANLKPHAVFRFSPIDALTTCPTTPTSELWLFSTGAHLGRQGRHIRHYRSGLVADGEDEARAWLRCSHPLTSQRCSAARCSRGRQDPCEAGGAWPAPPACEDLARVDYGALRGHATTGRNSPADPRLECLGHGCPGRRECGPVDGRCQRVDAWPWPSVPAPRPQGLALFCLRTHPAGLGVAWLGWGPPAAPGCSPGHRYGQLLGSRTGTR